MMKQFKDRVHSCGGIFIEVSLQNKYLHWAVHQIPEPMVDNILICAVQEFCYIFSKTNQCMIFLDIFLKCVAKPLNKNITYIYYNTAQCLYCRCYPGPCSDQDLVQSAEREGLLVTRWLTESSAYQT